MATEPGKERVGTPLGAARIDPRDIEEIVVEFDEGKEVLTHKINERFGSYDLDEAARYIFFLSNHIAKGGYWMGRRRAGQLHGVEVRRRATNDPGDRRASEAQIRRICIRYEDGRKVCFVPERGRSSSPKTTRRG